MFHICEALCKRPQRRMEDNDAVMSPETPSLAQAVLAPPDRTPGTTSHCCCEAPLMKNISEEKILFLCQAPFLAPALSSAGPRQTQRCFRSSSLTPPPNPEEGPLDRTVHLEMGPATLPSMSGCWRGLCWKPTSFASVCEFLSSQRQIQQGLPGNVFLRTI